ncbi:MAG: GGDEF domain-containing protein [Actinobacteria bacterium]|nr:GGDEF domain-containing protein [Actinomycetota bacterium]
MLAEELQGQAPWLLRVRGADRVQRVRAVNALVICYGTTALALLAAPLLALIPGAGLAVSGVVVVTALLFLGIIALIRSGRVSLGLTLFFVVFLASFAVSILVLRDARLTALYATAPVVVAGVTLPRRGVAAVTAAALVIGIGGTLLFPISDGSPIQSFEVILATVAIAAVDVVAALLGMWGQRQETLRADRSAREANDLAGRLALINAELERRVDERTEALQRALSQQETLVAELADLSLRDPLTGLYNRRHVEQEVPRLLAAAERYGTPLALALADLDHFKRINDLWSYSTGDEVLLRFTELLRETSRGTDLVARYGGEEFLLVMPQTTAEQARVVCERLRRAVEAHGWDDVAPDLHLTVSVGVAGADGRSSLLALTAAADRAVHDAKRAGRNRVEVAPDDVPPEAVEALEE